MDDSDVDDDEIFNTITREVLSCSGPSCVTPANPSEVCVNRRHVNYETPRMLLQRTMQGEISAQIHRPSIVCTAMSAPNHSDVANHETNDNVDDIDDIDDIDDMSTLHYLTRTTCMCR